MSEAKNLAAQVDFERALLKGFLGDVAAFLRGRSNELLSFGEVKDRLHIRCQGYAGLQAVPTVKIVGSVNRYRDFDHQFLPTQTHTKERWLNIDAAHLRQETLPPVELYKVGDVYFVRDGNHRVSVAKERGQEFIDAEIIECSSRVPMDETVSPQQLLVKQEYADFLEHTALDRSRSDQHIQFSALGGYHHLEEHIAVHRHFLGVDQEREVTWQEAASSWYDSVYMPVVRIIRQRKVLDRFPHLTEADLYLWIMDHRYYLSQEYGHDVGAEQATRDFAGRFGRQNLLRWVTQRWQTLRRQFRSLKGNASSGPGREATGGDDGR
jgi:hypothetical protein